MEDFWSWVKNCHLLAKLAWMAYRFKMWMRIKYGLAILAMLKSNIQGLADKQHFLCCCFLE